MTPDKALEILEKHAAPLPAETVALEDAFDRVLARPFAAPFDMPPFSRSAMDGYAVRGADVADASVENPVILRVAGTVLAGADAVVPLQPGTAWRIATGGALPPGADTVLRQEDVLAGGGGESRLREGEAKGGGAATLKAAAAGPDGIDASPSDANRSGNQPGHRPRPDARIAVTKPVPLGKDVVAAGAKARRGQVLLPVARRLQANDIALLAAFGTVETEVVRRPRVAYVETGDELASPGEPLPPGHIYGSNNVMLALRGREHGARVVARRRIGDESKSLAAAFDELLESADVVVSTGGVSVGPKDLVPDALRTIGCELLFHGLPVRPGHPILAARRGDKLWIGLAGNPTAALVTHEFFVRPVLWRLGGLCFAQGFNPAVAVAVDGPPLKPRPRTSLYLGQLHSRRGVESVLVDRERRPTALPAPFPFNAIARSDPPAKPAASDHARPEASGVQRVHVYPADRALAEARLTPFPADVGGILLAGGRSRRMGHSKLVLPVGGVPLIVRAYRALAEICARVRVIGAPADAVELLAEGEGEHVRSECFPDDRPGEGPLAGLITGLRRTPESVALCLAVDLPFVDANALSRLLKSARSHIPRLNEWDTAAKSPAASPPPSPGNAFRRCSGFGAATPSNRPAGSSPEPDTVSDAARDTAPDAARDTAPDAVPGPIDCAFVLSEGGRHQPLAALYPVARALAKAEAVWAEGGRAVRQFVARLGTVAVEVDVPGTLANVNTPDEYRAARLTADFGPRFRPFSGSGSGAPAHGVPGPGVPRPRDPGSDVPTPGIPAPDVPDSDVPTPDVPAPGVPGGGPPLLAFGGHSGSGKTTLIRRLIPLLKEQGLRVVVIKHGKRFELDKPGKDSWHFRQAGADGVILAGPNEFAYMAAPAAPRTFAELVRQAEQDSDVIIVEGFKAERIPKVVVLRPDETWAEHPLAGDPWVVAVYGGRGTDSSAGEESPSPIPTFPRTPMGAEDAALSWALDWIARRLP